MLLLLVIRPLRPYINYVVTEDLKVIKCQLYRELHKADYEEYDIKVSNMGLGKEGCRPSSTFSTSMLVKKALFYLLEKD